jgi:GAF domain-containing protein
MAEDRIVDSLEALAEVLQDQQTLGGVLARIAEVATRAVPRCDAATIAISLEGRPSTAAITARVALELDLVQYDTDDGPCLTAFRTLRSVRIDLVDNGDVFPHVAAAARRLGIRSVLSVPAVWRSEAVGTMNLYSRTGPFDETAETIATVLAAQVAMAISRSPEFGAARSVVDEAQQEADERSDVNVATGLLMVNEACTAEQAQGLLRSAATSDERTIAEIARRIIDQHHRD